MKVRFHEIIFNVEGTPNITATRIQSNVEKGEHTLDDILSEVKASDEITFYNDDDEISGVYSGYSKPIAISIVFDDGKATISVEIENENIMSQIEALTKRIYMLEQTRSETAN